MVDVVEVSTVVDGTVDADVSRGVVAVVLLVVDVVLPLVVGCETVVITSESPWSMCLSKMLNISDRMRTTKVTLRNHIVLGPMN